ncbi:hypothetical protein I3843_07G089800 [Carya illinoinensis]|nr:hypothetical protein I3843_07G089800 [Carya illinoinensis]
MPLYTVHLFYFGPCKLISSLYAIRHPHCCKYSRCHYFLLFSLVHQDDFEDTAKDQ